MRIFFVTLALCQIILSGSCQIGSNAGEVVTIPLDLTTRRPILEVTIREKGPFRFIFDTGSSGNVIDQELARDLSLNVVGQDPLMTPGSSDKLMAPRVAVPDIGFMGVSFSQDTEMSVINLRGMLPIDGILSGEFFNDYMTTIDYPQSSLTLTKGELHEGEEGVVNYTPAAKTVNLNIEVSGQQIEAHFDSGNPGGFALPYSWIEKLNFDAEPKEDGIIKTPVASFKKWKAKLVGEIRIGNIVFENPDVALIENFEFVNLGYSVVKDLRVTTDRKNNLILFAKSAGQSAALDGNEVEVDSTNEFTGWYGGMVRKVFIEEGEMFLQRGNAPKLKLELIEKDHFKMTIGLPVANELPEVRFERSENGLVTGLTFVSRDGEEFIRKD